METNSEVESENDKDLLVDDDIDDDIDDDGGDIDEEHCSGDNDDLDEESRENDRDSDSGTTSNAQDAKTPQESHKRKGSLKKKGWLKKVARAVMRPLSSKLKWNVNLNLDVQASNKTGQAKGNSKRNADAATIKNLKAKNKRLKKLNNTLKAKYAAESERNRVTVAELRKKDEDTCAQLANMANKCDELCRDVQAKDKELETITKQREVIAQELQKTTEEHRIRFDDLTESLTKMENAKIEISERNALIVAEISQNLEQMERSKKEAESKIVAMKNKLIELQTEKYKTQNDLDVCQTEIRNCCMLTTLQSITSAENYYEKIKNRLYTCPLCNEQFKSLGTMQFHAEDCG